MSMHPSCHQGSEGGYALASYCQIYTPEFVELLAESVEATWEANQPQG